VQAASSSKLSWGGRETPSVLGQWAGSSGCSVHRQMYSRVDALDSSHQHLGCCRGAAAGSSILRLPFVCAALSRGVAGVVQHVCLQQCLRCYSTCCFRNPLKYNCLRPMPFAFTQQTPISCTQNTPHNWLAALLTPFCHLPCCLVISLQHGAPQDPPRCGCPGAPQVL
jgi:hypothetical protein